MLLQNIFPSKCLPPRLSTSPSPQLVCQFSCRITRRRIAVAAAAGSGDKSSSDSVSGYSRESIESDEATDSRTLRTTKPRKPRRGRRSEAAAVEDFVRDSLDRTFASIRQQNPEVFEQYKEDAILKQRKGRAEEEEEDDDDNIAERDKDFVVEEESSSWPVDADVGWGIRASEYFEQHSIRNIVGEDGAEIDWEGEVEDSWVKEINCLEWESFAFHPSPLIVLVFERYNRASDNWKALKELENAIKVYWNCKDRLPPRAIKLDMNIERDLAYALKVKNVPQVLFLRGNKVLYRETEFRTADELVQMIAFFYYNAKKPSCIKDTTLNPTYKF